MPLADHLGGDPGQRGASSIWSIRRPFALGDRSNELSIEDCGSTQHYLPAGRVFTHGDIARGRSVVVAGPANEESAYPAISAQLIRQTFSSVSRTVWILGIWRTFRRAEYVGAGLWATVQGKIESPTNRLLKLLLTEVYAANTPGTRCLSLDFKHQRLCNQSDVANWIPTVMLYRRKSRPICCKRDEA